MDRIPKTILIFPTPQLHASSPHNPRRVDHRPPPRRASATNTHTVPDHHLSGFSPRISVPSQHYATPPASISEKLPESLDLLPDTLWFEHRMQRPAPNVGNFSTYVGPTLLILYLALRVGMTTSWLAHLQTVVWTCSVGRYARSPTTSGVF